MLHLNNLKNLSFLVYGLGSTGNSVVKFFVKKGVKNYFVWDDNKTIRKNFKSNSVSNLQNTLNKVDYIVLSPGISLNKPKNKKNLFKFKKKIIIYFFK